MALILNTLIHIPSQLSPFPSPRELQYTEQDIWRPNSNTDKKILTEIVSTITKIYFVIATFGFEILCIDLNTDWMFSNSKQKYSCLWERGLAFELIWIWNIFETLAIGCNIDL